MTLFGILVRPEILVHQPLEKAQTDIEQYTPDHDTEDADQLMRGLKGHVRDLCLLGVPAEIVESHVEELVPPTLWGALALFDQRPEDLLAGTLLHPVLGADVPEVRGLEKIKNHKL